MLVNIGAIHIRLSILSTRSKFFESGNQEHKQLKVLLAET